jgi:hypothetical protein
MQTGRGYERSVPACPRLVLRALALICKGQALGERLFLMLLFWQTGIRHWACSAVRYVADVFFRPTHAGRVPVRENWKAGRVVSETVLVDCCSRTGVIGLRSRKK